jgi:hypothetical protein
MSSINYEDITTEDCFVLYHTRKIACECNADEQKINFVEE